ncbi:MAG: hypothetical protein FJ191_09015 [Gammaproteobacteria bacterium]|nr:hypothetical protein [Gammaproteobacteria bacterium]
MAVTLRRLLRLVPLGLLLAGAAAIAWLVTTEAGLARVVALVESLDAVRVRVDGASGRLIGPLQVRTIAIEHRRATVRIAGFSAEYAPLGLLTGRIAARTVRADSVDVYLPAAAPRTAAAPAFTPRWLRIAIGELRISELRLVTAGGNTVEWRGVSAALRVSSTRIRFADLSADAGQWRIHAARGRLFAADPLDLRAEADWSLLRSGTLAGHATVSGDLDRLSARLQLTQPGRATANVTLTDVARALRWRADIGLSELDLGRWLPEPPVGPLRARLEASGGMAQWRVTGDVHGAGLPASGLRLAGTAALAGRTLAISRLLLSQPGGALQTEARARITLGAEPQFSAEAQWSALAWPLSGTPRVASQHGTLTAAGWREFSYHIGGHLQVGSLPAIDGAAGGLVTASQLIVSEATLATLGGRIELSGMVGRDALRPWTLTGRAQDLDPSALRADLPGRLSFDFAASGAGFDAAASWAAAVHSLTGTLRGQRAAGQALLRRRPGRWEFERVALGLGAARLRLAGHWDAAPELTGTLRAHDLSGFVPELGGSLSAALQLRQGVAELTLAGRDLAWKGQRAAVVGADARVQLDGRGYSWLRLRGAGLEVAGQSLAATRLSLDGTPGDHRVEFRTGVGDDALDLLGHGGISDAQYTLDLSEIAASGPRAPPYRLESPARFSASRAAAGLTPACFVAGARRFCMAADWHSGGHWSLHAQTRAFPLEALDLDVPGQPHYQGLLAATAQVHRHAGGPWLAKVEAQVTDATFRWLAPGGRQQVTELGRTELALSSDAERHHLRLRVIDTAAAELTGELVASRTPDAALASLPVSGHLRGASARLDLLPLIVPDIDRAAGRVTLDLAVGGRLGAPELAGEMRLTDGALDFYQANLRLRDVGAVLMLRDDRLMLNASALAGAGRLQADGELGWHERRLAGHLALRGEELLLIDLPEARVLAAPDLRFDFTDRRVEVSGSVTVSEARLRPADTASAVLASPDERLVGTGDDRVDRGLALHSDLRLLLGERVELDAWGLRGRITGALRLRSHPHEPATATGELGITAGRYRAYTRELAVERGRLLFGGGPVTDPGVDLRAARSVPGHQVGVLVRGPLRHPQLTLYSEPSLPQAQIAALLIVGRTLDSLQTGERGSLAGEHGNLATQSGALLAGQLGRYLGLDDVGLSEQGGAAGGTALLLGKFLSPRLYVSYGISLVDEINTFKLRYTIGDRWAFAAETGRESAVDVEIGVR